jgi:hypothetical protein
MSPLGRKEAAGSKNARGCYTVLPVVTAAGGWKNAKIYIITRAKKMDLKPKIKKKYMKAGFK